MIEIKKLEKKHIKEILPLVQSIQDPLLEQSPGDTDQAVWEQHFDQHGLLYGGYVYGELAGYLFIYEEVADSKIAHCWQIGVIEKYRGKELLKFMMDEAVVELKKKGFTEITISTYAEKYPLYHQYLLQNQFMSMYKDKMVDARGVPAKVVSLKKSLV